MQNSNNLKPNIEIEKYDLMFITDATGSMMPFIQQLKNALPQIFDLVQLTNLVDEVSVLAYRDYGERDIIEWSGWKGINEANSLSSFVEDLVPYGGGDIPEAVKTGLIEACKKLKRPTICIMYFDAPPHHKFYKEKEGYNYKMEVKALGESKSQWLNICTHVKDHRMIVFPIFNYLIYSDNPFFCTLAQITGGKCIETQIKHIARTTIGVLLNLGGIEFEHDSNVKGVRMRKDFVPSVYLKKDCEKYTLPPEYFSPEVVAISQIQAKIGDPISLFKTSEEYKNLVFSVFDRIMSSERVMSFTYNTLFGKLWRSICDCRKDPRRESLVVKLSVAVTSVPENDREILQEFLDLSYDKTVEINEILRDCGNEGPFYVSDHEENLTRKIIYEVGLSCAPSVLTSISKILRGLRISNQKPTEGSKMTYIPVNLEPKMKFRLLPHLMCPGTMFTKRLSLIMAAISKISRSVLQEDAIKCLNEYRGSWIDFTLPENNSLDFARLMMKVSAEALTEEEIKYFKALIQVGSFKKSKNRELIVEVSYSSDKTKRPDYKSKCKTCHQWRSMSLLFKGTCAMCVTYLEEENPDQDEKMSWMCECRKCLVHYSVHKIEKLSCRPKCHFCRLDQVAPYIECKECRNKFLCQNGEIKDDFICAVCDLNGSRVVENKNVTVMEYVRNNGAGFIGMEIEKVNEFFDSASRLSKTTPEERLNFVRNFSDITEDDLSNHKIPIGLSFKKVWNVNDLQNQVYEIFRKPKMGHCVICFLDVPENKLTLVCGNKKNGCSAMSCRPCLTAWYNQLSPGSICHPAQLFCPCCKNPPFSKIVRQYNRMLCTLMDVVDVEAFDPSYIYAWCIGCYKIKEAMQRECGGPNPVIVDFKCNDCIESMQNDDAQFKKCPSCNVMTERIGGCGHIDCQNTFITTDDKLQVCDTHWCWYCGRRSTYNDIYKHLSIVHGGFFLDDDDEYEEN